MIRSKCLNDKKPISLVGRLLWLWPVLLLLAGCSFGSANADRVPPTPPPLPTAAIASAIEEEASPASELSEPAAGSENESQPAGASPGSEPSTSDSQAVGDVDVDAPVADVDADTDTTADAETEEISGEAVDGGAGEGSSSAVQEIDPFPLNSTTNILLLGSDRRPDTPNWRTDVIMIVAIDFERQKAGVLSIPRDVYIDEIPEHYPNRVNVIDYLGEQDKPDGGGPALFSGIIQEKMGIPIDHYVRFDFEAFREIVDALDGVDVEVDCAFNGFIEDEGGWLVLEPGIHRLDGNQSMIYVRSRKIGGDLDRARRQQRFIWAVRNQVFSEKLLTSAPSLYAAISDSIQTDIGLVQAIRFARFVLDLDTDKIHGMVLAPPDLVESGWRDGMSVFVPNWELIRSEVQRVFERPPFAQTNTIGPDGDSVYCP